jgi:hypothetical protein
MHQEYPYPSDLTKKELAFLSGKSVKQVSQWFCNARKRKPELVEISCVKKKKLIEIATKNCGKL